MAASSSIEQKLLDDSIVEVAALEKGQLTGTFIFSSDFPAFEGHFPGQPVLPAVVQLAAVRMLVARQLDKQLVPGTVDRAKFKKMIGPDELIKIDVKLDQQGDDVGITFVITTDKGKASSGEIACKIVSR